MRNLFALLSLLALVSLSYAEKKKTIYLIRNGETSLNTDSIHRVGGRTNVPLSDLGVAHCKAAGDFLSNQNIGKIYYSSIPRARQSAEYIAKQHKTPVKMVDNRFLIETSFGACEGKPIKKHSEMKTEEILSLILKN